MYDPRTIANYFLYLAFQDRVAITPMKLQKLVYFAHGHFLAITGVALINDCIQAWRWGPVIPSLYHAIKEYGKNPIKEHIVDERYDSIEALPSSDPVKQFLNRIWSVYGKLTAIQLSNMSHEDGGPWKKVWSENQRNAEIPSKTIEEFFRERMNLDRV